MSVRVFVGEDAVAAVSPHDRGLAYGDGLFETMRAWRGTVPWWPAHWARLAQGAARLGMALPPEHRVRAEAEALLDEGAAEASIDVGHGCDNSVLKLLVTRGTGGRGYAPPEPRTPTWVLSRHPVPPPAPVDGLVLRWCDTRLALQPALAGIKHCNRLEQVLARAEWRTASGDGQAADEGLMRSTEGDVVCATAANLFILRDGRWWTPSVDRCGIAGVCRRWALDALAATESRLNVTDVESADAIFLCNAVRGILPAARLGARTWPPHPQVAALQQRLAAEHPAFAPESS